MIKHRKCVENFKLMCGDEKDKILKTKTKYGSVLKFAKFIFTYIWEYLRYQFLNFYNIKFNILFQMSLQMNAP